MNFNLHILLAEETSIFMYPEFGAKWASYMNGGEAAATDGDQSWRLASQKIHALVNPVATLLLCHAPIADCVNDTLQSYTDNGSTDPSEILSIE